MRTFYLENTQWIEGMPAAANNGKAEMGIQMAAKLKPQNIYLSAKVDLELLAIAAKMSGNSSSLKVINIQSQNDLLSKSCYPKMLGRKFGENSEIDFFDFIDGFDRPVSLGLVSPYGRSLGDSVIFLTLVRELIRLGASRKKELKLHLISISMTESIDILFRNSGLFETVNSLPYPLSDFARFDGYIDFIRSHLHINIPWIDSLFEMSGIKPETVTLEAKRNKFQLNASVQKQIQEQWRTLKKEIGRPIIIFHRQASTPIRSMPEEVYMNLVKMLAEKTDYHFVSLTPMDFDHSRFTDISELSSSLDHYAALIAIADGFITVDTSFYHLADAFDTPGVVLFTTNALYRFAQYYPFIKSLQLEGGDKLKMMHWSNNPADIAYAEGLWSSLDFDKVALLLNESMSLKTERWQLSVTGSKVSRI